VPYVAALIGDGGKYYLERKPIEDEAERRRHRHRGPTLRSLVKMAMRNDDAERLSNQLRQRYPLQRRRIAPPGGVNP